MKEQPTSQKNVKMKRDKNEYNLVFKEKDVRSNKRNKHKHMLAKFFC